MKKDQAVVPALWWFAIRNILVVSERHKRITESDTDAFLRDLAGLRVQVDREPEERWFCDWRASGACRSTMPRTWIGPARGHPPRHPGCATDGRGPCGGLPAHLSPVRFPSIHFCGHA